MFILVVKVEGTIKTRSFRSIEEVNKKLKKMEETFKSFQYFIKEVDYESSFQ